MSYLVYCILGAGGGAATPVGVDGQPIRLIEEGGLGAAVSRVSAPTDGMRPDTSRLLTYEKVVEALHRGRAVLPVRYGCLLADESEVIELLRSHRRAYRSALRELEGCEELGVRILAEDAEGGRGASRPDVPGPSPGSAYLAARRVHYEERDGRSEGQVATAERCRAAFAGLFVKYKVEYPSGSHPIFLIPLLSLYFLVKRENLDAFHRAFQSLSRGDAARMLLSGPWPPYNFVPSEETSPTPIPPPSPTGRGRGHQGPLSLLGGG